MIQHQIWWRFQNFGADSTKVIYVGWEQVSPVTLIPEASITLNKQTAIHEKRTGS